MIYTHYLRIEGVNLSRFVFDTRNLSTVRGGGLMLLDAVDTALKVLRDFCGGDHPVTPVSMGASVGIFQFEMPAGRQEAEAADTVRSALMSAYPGATFVVGVRNADSDFLQSSEALLAQNRWQQMQIPTVPPPQADEDSPEHLPACELDGVQPARVQCKGPFGDGRPTYLSRATHYRYQHGRAQRDAFYVKRLGANPANLPHKFAREFEHIANCPRASLHGKLAVFYADGNKFGEIQRTWDTAARQQTWDVKVREKRQQFMAAFLEKELACDPTWLNPVAEISPGNREPRYRFETLLWGGDELMFVMPAWKGWSFACRFFEAFADWKIRFAAGDEESPVLTHSAALVFCQHHAPIHRIRDLAGLLVRAAKDLNGYRDQLAYQILESVDHIGGNLDAAIARRYHTPGEKSMKFSDLVFSPSEATGSLHKKLKVISDKMQDLQRKGFARTQLRALVSDWLRFGKPRYFADACAHLSRTAPDAIEDLKALEPLLGGGLPMWVNLEELWDYATP